MTSFRHLIALAFVLTCMNAFAKTTDQGASFLTAMLITIPVTLIMIAFVIRYIIIPYEKERRAKMEASEGGTGYSGSACDGGGDGS